jgi:DNA replication protein DnaC
MKLTDDELDALLKRLHLANARKIWANLVERAEKEQWAYRDFLALLVAEEIAQRQQTRLGRLSHRARFPFFKTIDDFNFTYQSTLRLALLGSALAPDFITEGRCLILYGKPGRGKTHLAVALAYRAIQNGFDAYFTTAAELIDDLSAAFRQGRLAEALTTYTHPGLLVVDEVGYLTYGTDAANMLFHVVNDRHRRKHAMIFTTNKPTNAWGRVLHDEDLAQAIVDRILERGRLLTLDGPSMRTKHLGLDDVTSEASNREADNLARISGIARPEFPEPALVRGFWPIRRPRPLVHGAPGGTVYECDDRSRGRAQAQRAMFGPGGGEGAIPVDPRRCGQRTIQSRPLRPCVLCGTARRRESGGPFGRDSCSTSASVVFLASPNW